MKHPKHTLTLFCQTGCGREVGTAEVFRPMTQDEYVEEQDIADLRCGVCEESEGTFRELVDEFKEKTGDVQEDKAIAFIKQHRTRADFRPALTLEVDRREKLRKKEL